MSEPTAAAGLEESIPLDGFNQHLGLRLEVVTTERVVAVLTIDERHLQPYGIVHGGIYASMAETVASIGAAVNAAAKDPRLGCVGLENHTSFLRAARAGTVAVAEATPLHAGRRTQAWNVGISDRGSGRELARSTVRLMVLAPADLGGG